MLFIPIGADGARKADYTIEQTGGVKPNAGSLIIQGPAVNQRREHRHLQRGDDAFNYEPSLPVRCHLAFPKAQLQYA